MTKLLLLPVLLLAACATRSAIEQSRDHTRLGEHARAFQVLDDLRRQQLAAEGTVDPELETAHRAARLEFLRSRAQQNIFQEKEDLALADLAELEALAPDYPGVAALRERAHRKKADRFAARGDECLIRKDFVGAMAFYLESQQVIENARATEGMERVREATAGLSMRAREQFLEAVRKLPEFRHVEVQWHTGNALVVAPERDDARALQQQARRENALAAMRRAKANESAGRYGAALIDYRTAQRIDKETPGADEGIALMERELKAALLMDRAQLAMRAGRFTDAREQLAEAYELSVLTRNDVAMLKQQARRLEAERRYRSARDLEVLGQKAAALAAFEEIAKEWPDGLLDEQARIAGLRADVEGARQEWEAAEAAEVAGNLQQALEHYRNSERFYAGWRDGAERIARLRDAIAKQAAGGNDDGNG